MPLAASRSWTGTGTETEVPPLRCQPPVVMGTPRTARTIPTPTTPARSFPVHADASARHNNRVPTNNDDSSYATSTAPDPSCSCSCSCASVGSCAGTVLADCIALCCCCPCAAISLLVLAFLRVPWALGRRGWRRWRTRRAKGRRVGAEDDDGNKKKNKRSKKDKRVLQDPRAAADDRVDGGDDARSRCYSYYYYDYDDDDNDEDDGWGGNGRGWGVEDEYEAARGRCSCAWRDAEKVWMELYQAGHIGIGFGRVSFTGLPHANRGVGLLAPGRPSSS